MLPLRLNLNHGLGCLARFPWECNSLRTRIGITAETEIGLGTGFLAKGTWGPFRCVSGETSSGRRQSRLVSLNNAEGPHGAWLVDDLLMTEKFEFDLGLERQRIAAAHI